MNTQIPARNDVDSAYTWDAASIFPTDAAWEHAFADFEAHLADATRFRGHLHESPALLADWLGTVDDWQTTADKLYIYASMFHHVDATNSAAAARYSRAMGMLSRTQAATSFTEPELLAIGTETIYRWMDDEPRLAVYRHYFDQLQHRAAHVRSAEVEELLGEVSAPFATAAKIHGILSDADLVFAPARGSDNSTHDVGHGTIGALLTHADREVRRSAWDQYADAFLNHKHGMAACLETGVKQQVFVARTRRYPSALEASLGASNIPTDVFHNLIATFRKHLPTWHRYWRIRRKALGYDQLHVYDIKAPLGATSPAVPFDTAVAWISEGMQPLGDEYVAIMQRGLGEERWVDVYPNQGKRMGAFSTGTQGTRPFILMSYNDDIFSMSTLAHELGHSLHSYYAWETQPPVYADYSLFVAEVASNFNQALVRAHLLKSNQERDFQIAVIEEAMSNFHRYFFIMPTLARFELEIHERVERGEALPANELIKLMTELFAEGYGNEVVVDADRVGITWAQFPTHLYANFYVYQYATGIAGANALADGVLHDGPAAAARYLDFLRTGGARYPLDALKIAGVDLLTPEPVERAFGVMADYVDRLEKLV